VQSEEYVGIHNSEEQGIYVGIPKRAEPGYAGIFNKDSRARNMLLFIGVQSEKYVFIYKSADQAICCYL